MTDSNVDVPAGALAPRLRDVSVSTDREAFEVLMGMARGDFGHIDTALLVTLVLDVTAGGDWPLRMAAMQALSRRWKLANDDALRLSTRPQSGVLGLYRTRRKGQKPRPYATQLLSLRPFRARCDCPDFLHNGLGACKHILSVLDALYARPRSRAAVEDAMACDRTLRPVLLWDPVRPLTGLGDWLERVSLMSIPPARNGRRSSATQRLAAFFEPSEGGASAPRSAFVTEPTRRQALIGALLKFAERKGPAEGPSGGVDVALLARLRAERQRLSRAPGISGRELSAHLRSLRQPLYGYQRQGVECFLSNGRLLLADDMGLGKTAQATACCHVLFRSRHARRGLLIVPASLKSQWLREWQRFSDTPIAVVDGSPRERETRYRSFGEGFLVINYEQLLRDLQLVQAFAPDVVVLDEAQRIKNWATKTSAYVKALDPPYRLVLTGTPMENRLEELASIMQWVDGAALEPTWRLAPWHVTRGGARHLDTLRARLSGSMIRRVRQEVLDQLPARTDTQVLVPMTEEQASAHADLEQPIAQLASIAQRRPLTQKEFLRLMSLLTTQRMICNGLGLLWFEDTWAALQVAKRCTPALLRGLFSPKLLELRELLSNLVVDQGRKVVVFSQWRRMLLLAHWVVSDLLSAAGLRAVFFTGQESQKRRTHNVVDFHDDDAVRVLFATDAGGVGLNLQRAAHCCINLELPWNPAVIEQRIGRIYRLGQHQPVEAYSIVSEAGIESRIAGLVHSKRALTQGLFDGQSDEIQFDQAHTFLQRLQRVIEPVALPSQAVPVPDADPGQDGGETSPGLIEAGSEDLGDGAGPSSGEVSPAVATLPLAELVTQVQVRVGADGGLQLSAPPAATASLIGLLEGLAAQLRQGQVPAE